MDGNGTLADIRNDILFSSNYHSIANDVTSSLINNTPSSLTPGQTTKSSSLHGMEISFMDKLAAYRKNSTQLGMKYYVDGAEIGKFDRATSNAETSSGTNNAWDGLIASIDKINEWASVNGYTLTWKGFVWWQGESHMGRSASEHQTLLNTLISNVRTYVGNTNLPVSLIQVDFKDGASDMDGTGATSISAIQEIQTAQLNVANSDDFVKLVDTLPYVDNMIYTPNSNDNNNTVNTFRAVHWKSEAHVPIGILAAGKIHNLIEGITYWTPKESNVITGWYDASDTSTVILSSESNVSTWKNNKNLGDLSQTNISYQPVLQSNVFTGIDNIDRPGIFFNRGSSDRLDCSSGFFGELGSNLTEISMFMVIKYPDFPMPTDTGNSNVNTILWGHSMGNSSYTSGFAHFPANVNSDQTVVRISSKDGNDNNDIVNNIGFNNWLSQDSTYILEFTLSDTNGNYLMRVNGTDKNNVSLGSGWKENDNFVSGLFIGSLQ